MSTAAPGRRLPPRHVLAPLGIGVVAVALADRVAFFSVTGAVLLLVGVCLLGLAAASANDGGGDHVAYPPLLVGLSLLTALTTEVPSHRDPLVAALTVGGALAFYICTLWRPLRRYRLYVAGALLIAAHAVIIVRVAVPPHQDVWRFLNFGADALVHPHNPYGSYSGPDGLPVRLTYPPAVLLLLAPFRIVAGDIRWGYVVCEAAVVVLLPRLVRRQTGSVARWQEALVLIPLVLPRASQAFFVFSNQEWLLLALALGALYLAMVSRTLLCGLLLGLGMASKQYFVVFPLLYLVTTLPRRAILVGLATAAAITIPFLAADPGAFMDHVFGNLANAPDPDRLTLWAMLAHAGIPPSRLATSALTASGAVVALGLAWAGRRSLSSSLTACGFGLFAFTLGATFAAYNYYAYALVFVTWGLLLPPSLSAPRATPALELAR